VPEASHPTVASDARSGRILMAEHQVMSVVIWHHGYSRDFVSHPNGSIQRGRPETIIGVRPLLKVIMQSVLVPP
jgi:hypothetical protein